MSAQEFLHVWQGIVREILSAKVSLSDLPRADTDRVSAIGLVQIQKTAIL